MEVKFCSFQYKCFFFWHVAMSLVIVISSLRSAIHAYSASTKPIIPDTLLQLACSRSPTMLGILLVNVT